MIAALQPSAGPAAAALPPAAIGMLPAAGSPEGGDGAGLEGDGDTGPDPDCRDGAPAGQRPPHRILVVDDNAGILENFRRILSAPEEAGGDLAALEAVLFDERAPPAAQPRPPAFEVDCVHDGALARARAAEARAAGRPYAVAFVDMRMPGGWDGLRTIEELWQVDGDIEIVICTAYSDFGWAEITARLGRSEQFLILRKPFEMIEVQQLAAALSQKWQLRQDARQRMAGLERQVAERTRHLDESLRELAASNARLSQALDAAAAAAQAKSRYFTGLSHELRTPLNAVIGYAEMLEQETFGPIGTPRYRDFAAAIAESGRHLLALIDDILDLSRLDAGHLPLQEEVLDAGEVAEECVRMMQPQAEQAEVALELAVEPRLPPVRADRRRLRQILLNLLSNATKFTPAGGRVRLAVRRGGGGLALEVADTGIGMAPEDIPTAVEQFGQIDSALGRRHKGSGLGLPLTKGLVELHGGSFAIDSAPGRGTTVTVTLPAERLTLLPPDSPH